MPPSKRRELYKPLRILKNLDPMNVNNCLCAILLLIAQSVFSQEKGDVYFILTDNDSQYSISFTMDGNKIGLINLLNRKENENRLTRISDEKKSGTYHGTTSNENYSQLSSLDFRVISESKIKLKLDKINKELAQVDFDWLEKNSWIQPNQKEIPFKNIYFLNKIGNDFYSSYKVERTAIAY